ncbi:MAG: hypothetical protein ACOC7U_09110 [Spirochaetota bacterium]
MAIKKLKRDKEIEERQIPGIQTNKVYCKSITENKETIKIFKPNNRRQQ